jgi:hypothetical protein
MDRTPGDSFAIAMLPWTESARPAMVGVSNKYRKGRSIWKEVFMRETT